MSVDAAAVIARLRELDERSGGRRVAWTEAWRAERERLCAWLEAEVPGVAIERDAAGNIWARLAGASEETVVCGSHLDCVPDGGWLDGCLGVLAGAAVLADVAARGGARRSLALVDFADEEGARFGHSLLGSSAATGLLDVEAAARLTDGDGTALPDVLAANGVALEAMPEAQAALRGAVAFVELHIEQGPVLDEAGLSAAAVDGCLGVRRTALTVRGRAGHAGATPMGLRRDPLQAAAAFVRQLRRAAEAAGGLATVGLLRTEPPTPTAIPGAVQLTVDLRHADTGELQALEIRAGELAVVAAEAEGCAVEDSRLWSIEPVRFDPRLVARAQELTGGGRPLTSGPLHDAAAVARAGVPTVMVFARTRGGVSHSREEDARDEDLAVAIDAFAELVNELVDA
jgi:N-carbamoyl-L-amino-acid hydrolase